MYTQKQITKKGEVLVITVALFFAIVFVEIIIFTWAVVTGGQGT